MGTVPNCLWQVHLDTLHDRSTGRLYMADLDFGATADCVCALIQLLPDRCLWTISGEALDISAIAGCPTDQAVLLNRKCGQLMNRISCLGKTSAGRPSDWTSSSVMQHPLGAAAPLLSAWQVLVVYNSPTYLARTTYCSD